MTRNGPSRPTTRRKPKDAPAKAAPTVPRVYREMLVENSRSSPTYTSDEGRSIKKRRIGGKLVTERLPISVADEPIIQSLSDVDDAAIKPTRLPPAIYTSETEDSVADEMDWEEVDFVENSEKDLPRLLGDERRGEAALDLTLEAQDHQSTRTKIKRRSVTASEKNLRLEIHKVHVLCLLMHVNLRNHWCNDFNVQRALRQILSKKIVSLLNLDETHSQHKRSVAFTEGLHEAVKAFSAKFAITARGMSRSKWAESVESIADQELPDDLDLPMQKLDFQKIAKDLKGSRDVGAQLFCALLRGVGVEARLVCSLQVLPLSQVTAPRQLSASILPTISYEQGLTAQDHAEDSDASAGKPRALGSSGGRTRQDLDSTTMSVSSKPKYRKRIKESCFPVCWVEAFDEAQQKWIAVDPLVTKTIGKPSRIEPPASDPENHLIYAIAFDDDSSARDVTQRYAKAFNAKTRKERLEVTKSGEQWWTNVIKLFKRKERIDRDQIEDTQLATKQAQEGMPGNVQDFKDHPFYVLERHLRKHEVIYPKREVGKVAVGRVRGEKVLEPVFRRQDVQILKSADKWYRQGREIKAGEQPLKSIVARRPREQRGREDDSANSEEEENPSVSLYSFNQTMEYRPASVKDGKIPKNAYGNLDIYTPTMIPPGASHISHPETRRVARLIGVDSADAVTGFTFKGRHGTANVNGAVVPTESCDAIQAVIEVLEDQSAEAEAKARSHEALRGWKKFLAALRIQERIKGYQIEGEDDDNEAPTDLQIKMGGSDEGDNTPSANDDENSSGSEFAAADVSDSDEENGGFLAEDAIETGKPPARDLFDLTDPGAAFIEQIRNARSAVVPYTVIHGPPLSTTNASTAPLGTNSPVIQSLAQAGGFNAEDSPIESGGFIPEDAQSGGFLPDADTGGGFLPKSGRAAGNLDPDHVAAATEDLFEESATVEEKTNSSLPVLSKQETEEARMLQQMYDEGQEDSIIASKSKERQGEDPEISIEDHDQRDALGGDTEMLGANQGRESSGSEIQEAQEAGEEEDDENALPLEDPEDEDADPEWLV